MIKPVPCRKTPNYNGGFGFSAHRIIGSSRVQTVSPEVGDFYRMLKHLKTLTGFGVVLNTSFNGPGETIMERPEEALTFLLTTELDALYMDGCRITRRI